MSCEIQDRAVKFPSCSMLEDVHGNIFVRVLRTADVFSRLSSLKVFVPIIPTSQL